METAMIAIMCLIDSGSSSSLIELTVIVYSQVDSY